MPIGKVRGTGQKLLPRCLAAVALVVVYSLSAAGILVTSGVTAASARGRGGGRGGHGHFRGRGRGGVGIWYGGGYYDPYCYWSRRWRRWICPY